MSLNQIRLCLYRVAQQMAPGGHFFATFFEAPRGHPIDAPLGDRRKWTEQNPFFYYRRDLRWAARWTGLEFNYIGRWGHPSGQRMVEFRRAASTPTEPPERRGSRWTLALKARAFGR